VLTGEEIRAALTAFAARWSVYEGTERSEAQTFLNELFACYGTDRSEVAHFEEYQAGRFVDLMWPRVCLIEMKAPAEAKRLAKHRDQALQYWRESADPETNTPAPPYVVLCAFNKLEIWEPGSFPAAPRVLLDLIDLPDQYDTLLFLANREPVFAGGQAELTREAVVHLVDLYEQLTNRRAADPDILRDFLLQCVWCLFAEDLGQIPEHGFMRILDELIANPRRSSEDDLGQLFECLNTPGNRPEHGLYAGTPYANGGLFVNPARVHLSVEELKHLRDAAQFQWRDVQPSIFGSLLEGGLGHDQQWRLSAHYTHEADIQKVVQPTIVEPWRERIENLTTHAEVVAAQYDLLNYVVLDPACGSGNFLYVAYRELRRLEKRLHERGTELRRKGGMKEPDSLSLYFPLSNMKGIEIESFAVALARVTLWMGHKLAVDELDLSESTLPLADLSGIQIGDALRIPWPRADAIIGNPPFHGSQHLRKWLGDEYVEWLKDEFGIGVKDYCVYWFRKAHAQLEDGGRAGLVGTNSISQNRARAASLEYILDQGGRITSAVSTQDWPGEAAVDVSIVNWVKNAPSRTRVLLDGVVVNGISAALRDIQTDAASATRLDANRDVSFQGPIPAAGGFVITDAEARTLLAHGSDYEQVVRPYLIGEDLAHDPRQQPSRWIIDFGFMPLETASQWESALRLVRERVKPVREKNRDAGFRERWWQFGRPRREMRQALSGLDRFIATSAVAKRFIFAWCDPVWCPSNRTIVFALSGDYEMGILSSRVHVEWAYRYGGTFEDRPHYTHTSAFETFPWPDPITDARREEISELARRIVARRQEICLERQIGLTRLYNEVDDGAYADLAALHRELDEAVCAAYGWPRSIAGDPHETNARLLALNLEIAAGRRPYDPFRARVE
jgi:hypothetical protein